MSLELTGKEYQQFRDALRKAFPSVAELKAMTQFVLGENLEDHTDGDLKNRAFQLIGWTNSRGRTLELVEGAYAQNPGNEYLRRFVEQTGVRPAAGELEKIVRDGDPEEFNDPEEWRAKMARREQAVCRVECPLDDPDGTGFLVGPDLLVTNHHVCSAVWEGRRPASDVFFRFGYRRLADGEKLPGVTYQLAEKDWLIDSSPAGQLDFVLVRLAKPAGKEKLGKGKAAAGRGWLTPRAYEFNGREMVFILQHPKGEPLKHACGQLARQGNPLVTYRANTLNGSSGSPVFLNNWDLVALHHRAHETEANEGIAFAAILPRPRVKQAIEQAGG